MEKEHREHLHSAVVDPSVLALHSEQVPVVRASLRLAQLRDKDGQPFHVVMHASDLTAQYLVAVAKDVYFRHDLYTEVGFVLLLHLVYAMIVAQQGRSEMLTIGQGLVFVADMLSLLLVLTHQSTLLVPAVALYFFTLLGQVALVVVASVFTPTWLMIGVGVVAVCACALFLRSLANVTDGYMYGAEADHALVRINASNIADAHENASAAGVDVRLASTMHHFVASNSDDSRDSTSQARGAGRGGARAGAGAGAGAGGGMLDWARSQLRQKAEWLTGSSSLPSSRPRHTHDE